MIEATLLSGDDWAVMTETLWSLGRLLEIKAVQIAQIAQTLRKIAANDPDAGVREGAQELLSQHGASSKSGN